MLSLSKQQLSSEIFLFGESKLIGCRRARFCTVPSLFIATGNQSAALEQTISQVLPHTLVACRKTDVTQGNIVIAVSRRVAKYIIFMSDCRVY